MELVGRPNSLEFNRRVSIQGYRLALRLCRVVPGLFAAICCPITDSLELPSRCKHLVGLAPLSPIRTKYRTGDGATLQSRAALIQCDGMFSSGGQPLHHFHSEANAVSLLRRD